MQLPRLFRSASFRLASLYLLLFLLSVGALAALLFINVRATLDNEVRSQITNEENLLLFEYREDGLVELLEETEERIEKNDRGERLLYMVQSPSGQVVFDRIAAVSPPFGWQEIEGNPQRLFHFTLLDNGYVLGVGKDLSEFGGMENALLHAFGWALVAVLVMGAAGGLILSRRTLAKVESINTIARGIGDGKLSERIPLRQTGDEFDGLGQTLNRMFDRIEHLVSDVRAVSTGIAHDLRTPLARLRHRLEELRERVAPGREQAELDTAISEVDGILQTFAALLRLAEVEAGALRSGFRRVDLSALVQQVVEAYGPLGEDHGIVFESNIRDHVEVLGDAKLLQQLLANLLENALQHAGRGVTVAVRLHAEVERILLEVADNGRGIPDEDRDKIIRPFERLETNRPDGVGGGGAGSGLGLALVAAIARLHEADLQLLDNKPGLLCRAAFPQPS